MNNTASYLKELKYINSISGLKRSFNVEYEYFYIWIDSERQVDGVPDYIVTLTEILNKNNIPFKINTDDVWGKVIVNISDVRSKLRNDKLNQILNERDIN